MEELVKIFNALKADSSKSGKEAILKANENNEIFKEVLKFVYNPYIVTGLSTKKINKKLVIDDFSFYMPNTISSAMSYLLKNNSGKDTDIKVIQAFIAHRFTEEERELATEIVTKSLKVGITEKTINKVYGKGFIPSFAVMLAESYTKKADKVKGKFYITLKLDGNRCMAIKENGKMKFFTRNGQQVEGLVELEKDFEAFPDGQVYDGELILINENNLPSAELFRATQKVVRKDGEKKGLEFHLFDTLPLDEFKNGKSKLPYSARRNKLDFMFTQFADIVTDELAVEVNHGHIRLLPVLYQGEDKAMINVLSKWAEENSYEGLMVNTADGHYVTKRSSDLLKVKGMKTADLLVMSMEEGTGKNKGKLGRINVEYKGGLTGVGSGFTDEQRSYYWNNPDEIVGKIVETQYFEESIDEKTKQPSLRFPVFKCVRFDKGAEDINYGE